MTERGILWFEILKWLLGPTDDILDRAEDQDLRNAILHDVIRQVATADETELQEMRAFYGTKIIDVMVAVSAKIGARR